MGPGLVVLSDDGHGHVPRVILQDTTTSILFPHSQPLIPSELASRVSP